MDGPSKTKNWRSQEDIKAFHEELRPRLTELFPNATRIQFTYNVVRGGSKFGDQPAAINVPHLDYSQNDTGRAEFHQQYPPLNQSVEHFALLGDLDTQDDYMGALLGIWKPILMSTPVCNHPLALMDARTFDAKHERPNRIHISFGVLTFHNLNGAIMHDPRQSWYYYPLQTETEVLIFTQYTRDRHFANPHSSFEVGCPDDFDSPRVSVEMRAAAFFPRQSTKTERTSIAADGTATSTD